MFRIIPRPVNVNPRATHGPELGNVAELPVGFDPQRFPIISRHVFGIDPTHGIGRAAAALVADLRFRNKMTVLLAMGNRPVAEMVAEFAVHHGLEAELDQVLDRYLEIPDGVLDVINGRDFAPAPLHEVEQ